MPRRSPAFLRWIGSGAVVGFLVGLVMAVVSADAANYGLGSQVAYLGVMFAFVGALLGGLVAVLVDRRA